MLSKKIVPGAAMVFVLLMLVAGAAIQARHVSAAVSYVVVIDLAHGESAKGLDVFLRTMYDAEVYVILGKKGDEAKLPPQALPLLTGILYGTLDRLTTADGKSVTLTSILTDILIIPQPTVDFSDEEINAIKSYLSSRNKALWLAGDSDYPPGERTISAINRILEAVGSSLALDYVSVEDPVVNAKAPYRVVAFVKPPQDLAFLGYAAEKVLMHGPGVVAFRDPSTDTWSPITEDLLARRGDIKVIVRSSPNGKIVENTAPPQGSLGRAYSAGQTGAFPMLVAQIMNQYNGSIVIVSSETPLGGYQPGITAEYYGIMLDGPRFVRNLVLWATGYMGELKEAASTASRISSLYINISSALNSLSNRLGSLEQQLKDAVSRIDFLGSRLSQVENSLSQIKDLDKRVSSLSGDLQSTGTMAAAALGIAVAGLLLGAASLLIRRR